MALQVDYYDTHIEDESESEVKKRSILRQQKKEEIKQSEKKERADRYNEAIQWGKKGHKLTFID